ncbi:IclR family transcriptional regulator [Rhodococcus wratislaviensis]|uniref:Putative IclR family transcriptional regulator n=1 Tax=Rhodococcus wratislaviensis NBRC 100605 TaxID=1219028 RepID=X0Q226_RHOWR|nr:IclR family transcriptional regulator [Rhodococcus wratislaviensis]GAF44341.1 putative IclR family transcriptional regulator [Rhodococcus wratislaviensis NBRC 100605]
MPARGESMIERVVRVLEAFKDAGGSLTASEIARQADIPIPSAHRIVTELVGLGILDRDADRRVRIGMRLWEIVTRSSGVLTLREIALPYMEDLRDVVNAPTLLSILDRNDVINVDTLSSRQPSATNVTQPGVRLPALASSPGMVLVAFAPPDVRERILEEAKVTRFTEHTVVDRTELARIVYETRRVGYVVARQWISPDATGIAVPILSDDGTALAALSVTTPFGVGVPSDLLPALHTTARGISRAFLAGSGHTNPRLTLLMQQIRHATDPT